MMTVLRTTRRKTLGVLRDIGVFRLCSDSAWRKSRLSILCYHGISLRDEHEWHPSLYMSAETFEQRLSLLKAARYNVLPLNEALTRMYEDRLPARSVSITFDDGFVDFAVRAAPLLERYGFPATVYLTTYYTKVDRPIFDLALAYVMWKRRSDMLDAQPLTGENRQWNLSVDAQKEDAYWRLVAFTKERHFSVTECDEFVHAVARQLGVDYCELLAARQLQLLKPDEVASLSAKGFDFQLHTHRHRTPLDQALFVRELRENRDCIVEYTGKDPTHFCYPSGIHRPEFHGWLRSAGVESATVCELGVATPRSHPLQLPRLMDSSRFTALDFEGWLTGVSSMLPRRKQPPARTSA